MILKQLSKFLFTWWNGSTVGTSIYTKFRGMKVGHDHLGNTYYQSKDKKDRWCIYFDQSEASRISPEWNSWLRFISDKIPSNNEITFKWQKLFNGNETGLSSAYKPDSLKINDIKNDLDSYEYDYKAWEPEKFENEN